MSIIGDIAHSLGRDLRNDARKVLVQVLLCLAIFLTGTAGVGFLTASAYLALSLRLGHGPAALLIGLGFLSLSWLLLFLFNRRPSQDDVRRRSAAESALSARGAPDAVSIVAFTAAFVLARALANRKR